MGYQKLNEYTGQYYECRCDYSYTCEACQEVRAEFVRRQTQASREQWIIDSIKKIAKANGVELEDPPEYPPDYR